MKNRTLIFALFVLVLPMVLAACGGGLDEGEFADAVEKALEDGDFGDYNDLVCDDDQIDNSPGGNEVNVSVDCTVEDDSVECDLKGEGDTTKLTADVDDDDKACNVVIGEGDNAIRLVDLLAITSGEGDEVPTLEPTAETMQDTENEATPEEEATPEDESTPDGE